ncbi:CT20-domain-containing protein [Astrocystis sublimbata]|nr:CT20-domain-containing protein [Astrocystis sublimbata]
MPPKRKSKAAEVSTPKASVTPARDEDAMDISSPRGTPRAADTPVAGKPNHPLESEVLGDPWSEDQISSLFKAIMRWKPSGMHKHFRVIAISEHLRNHGFDPDVETHTRIPGIWTKLRQFFNMDMIDERDNSFDSLHSNETSSDDDGSNSIYNSFDLPPDEFHDLMWTRAAATVEEPDNWDDVEDTTAATKDSATTGKRQPQTRKRKRGEAAETASVAGTAKTQRSSTVDDTDQETPAVSSPVSRSARGARSQKRAAAKAKTESVASERDKDEEQEEQEEDEGGEEEGEDDDEDGKEDEEDEGDEEEKEDDEEESDDDEEDEDNSTSSEEEDEEEDEEEEQEKQEKEAPATRSGRGGAARGRGRGRGRPKGGRKKN